MKKKFLHPKTSRYVSIEERIREFRKNHPRVSLEAKKILSK